MASHISVNETDENKNLYFVFIFNVADIDSNSDSNNEFCCQQRTMAALNGKTFIFVYFSQAIIFILVVVKLSVSALLGIIQSSNISL